MGNEQSTDGTDAKQKSTHEAMTAEMRKLQRHTAKFQLNPDGSLTFFPTPNCEASKEKPRTRPKPIWAAMHQVLLGEGCSKSEAMSDSTVNVLGAPTHYDNKSCSFIGAATEAWSAH